MALTGKNDEIKNITGDIKKPLMMKMKEVGLRSIESIAYHIATENTYDSNLINDIAGISYTEHSKGKMKLEPLEGVTVFFDDIYFCGFIFQDDIERNPGGGIRLKGQKDLKDDTKGNYASSVKGAAKKYLDVVKDECKHFFNEDCKKTKIFATPEFSSRSKSVIIPAMWDINRKSNNKILENAKKFKNTKYEPVGLVAVKVDVSNIPFKTVFENLDRVNESLNRKGFANFQTDITRDFAGTLERDALYNFFLSHTSSFIEEKEEKTKLKREAIENGDYEYINFMDEGEEKAKLLNRRKVEKTAGFNIVKYTKKIDGLYIRVKFYNKIVSNFEAGDTQKKFGSHLAEYAYNHNDPYLKNLFNHPQVKECGLTRLEVSVCTTRTKTNFLSLINEEYDFIKHEKIFHIQPPAQQWLNLASKITRTCLIANRTIGGLFMAWYGSSSTNRVCGVRYPVLHLKNETEDQFLKRWKQAKKEVMSDFGFNQLPINVVEF